MKTNVIYIKVLIWTAFVLIGFVPSCFRAYAGTRTDYANIPGTCLYDAPDVTEEQKASEAAVWMRLNAGVRDVLLKQGYTYTLINEKNDVTASGHTGCTTYSGLASKSEGRLIKDIAINGGVMNHEVGHAVDILYGQDPYNLFQASNDPVWQALYVKYKTTIAGFGGLSKWEVYNAREAFAEAYGHYTNNPEMVMKKAPEIALYMAAVNAGLVTRYTEQGVTNEFRYT